MRSWLSYAAAGLALTLAAALVGTALAGADGRAGVWFAAALSYLMQLVAFGAMLALRRDPQLFMLGWAAGIVLRFGAVGAVAFWLGRTRVWPLDVTLLSLVTFVVLLLFLEPVFLARGRPRVAAEAPGPAAAGGERAN